MIEVKTSANVEKAQSFIAVQFANAMLPTKTCKISHYRGQHPVLIAASARLVVLTRMNLKHDLLHDIANMFTVPRDPLPNS